MNKLINLFISLVASVKIRDLTGIDDVIYKNIYYLP